MRLWPRRPDVPGLVAMTESGEPLGGVVSDEAVRQRAAAMGAQSIPDEALWGPNRELYIGQEVVESAKVAIELVWQQLAERLGPIEGRLELRAPALADAERRVDDAAAARQSANDDAASLRAAILAEGHAVPEPQPWRRGAVVVGLVLSMLSELYLLGPAFAIMGVSDARLTPWLPLTYQHLAALGAVLMLWPLAHGERHELAEDAGGGPFGRWSWLLDPLSRASAGYRLRLAALAALLLGLTVVRESYLAATVGGDLLTHLLTAAGFLLINIGMVVGIRYLSRSDTRPCAARWEAAVRAQAMADAEYGAASDELVRLTGEQNADVALRESLTRQADHFARALGHHGNRKVYGAAEAVRAALPEPLDKPMFSGDMPALPVANPDLTAPAPVEPRTPARFERHDSPNLTARPGEPKPQAEAEAPAVLECPAEPKPARASKKAMARVEYDTEIGPTDPRSNSELGKYFEDRYQVHPVTARQWIAEWRPVVASRNGHGGPA